jgi:hypothetical protein
LGVGSGPDDAGFVAKLREQVGYLRRSDYGYDELHVYVCGIGEPWVFGPADEFEFADGVLVVRVGPVAEHDNHGVPEFAFPLRHVVASELATSGG